MSSAFTLEHPPAAPKPPICRAVVIRAPASEADDLVVQPLGFSPETIPTGQWMLRGIALPQVGDICLREIDHVGDSWVTAWVGLTVMPTTLPPDGPAGGDLDGSYPNPDVATVLGGKTPVYQGGEVQAGVSPQQAPSLVSAVEGGNGIEFGHPNESGYRSHIGAEAYSGQPFLVFSGEAGSSPNTYRTRGLLATIVRGNLAGGLQLGTVANADADDQAFQQLLSVDSSGNLRCNQVYANVGGDLTGSLPDPTVASVLGGKVPVITPQVATRAVAVGADYTASSGDFVLVNATGLTITLPAAPNVGDVVSINSDQSAVQNVTVVNGNGHDIWYRTTSAATQTVPGGVNATFRYSGSDWRCVSEGAGVDAPLVSSLPAGVVDGQEIVVQFDDQSSWATWRLRYNAGSASAFKWECVGGTPFEDMDPNYRAYGGPTDTNYHSLTNTPGFSPPFSGDYVVRWGAYAFGNDGTYNGVGDLCLAVVVYSTQGAVTYPVYFTPSGAYATGAVAGEALLPGLTAGTTYAMSYAVTSTTLGNNIRVIYPWMSMIPRRVG